MKKILLIESSPRGSDSHWHHAARSIVNELQRRNPGAKVIVRVEGVANSAIGPEKTLASARTQSKHVLAQLA
jgi:FMN-dependent NADH-azoreductase